jgi:predicted transcriptional regulator
MARKPSDVIQIKIRVREDLRRRLEQAANKADRSINSEMASRLADSFNLPKLNEITAGLENVYGRLANELRDHLLMQGLMRAADDLIQELPTEVQGREAVKRAIAEVQNAITAIAHVHGRTYEHEPWEDK